MPAWHYAFFFPSTGHQLDAAAAAFSLLKSDYTLSSTARSLIPIDSEGHLGEYGAEIDLGELPGENLLNRLRDGEQLFVELSKHDTSSNIAMAINCSFSTKSSNPHIYCCWHKGLFEQLPINVQNDHWRSLRSVAQAAKATYILLVVEASDNFEDRFPEVDGKRLLDTVCDHRYGHGIWAIWVNCNLGGECPVGVIDAVTKDFGDGFVMYSIA